MPDWNIFKLTPEQKSRLWSMGASKTPSTVVPIGDQQAKTELLLELLAHPWPHPKAKPQASFGQKQLYRDLLSDAGLNIGDILLNPKAELETLKSIRKYGSKMFYYDSDPIKRSVGVAIYYGAIAAALLYAQEKISEQTYPDLLTHMQELCQKTWVVPEIKRLLTEACGVCEKNIETKM